MFMSYAHLQSMRHNQHLEGLTDLPANRHFEITEAPLLGLDKTSVKAKNCQMSGS